VARWLQRGCIVSDLHRTDGHGDGLEPIAGRGRLATGILPRRFREIYL